MPWRSEARSRDRFSVRPHSPIPASSICRQTLWQATSCLFPAGTRRAAQAAEPSFRTAGRFCWTRCSTTARPHSPTCWWSMKLAVGAAGPTRISVRNAGGAGDLTVGDGILVVEGLNNGATANVPHAFGLGAPVVAGPYEYFLFRGGTGAGASDDWFLRNTLGPVPPEPPGPPGNQRPAPPGRQSSARRSRSMRRCRWRRRSTAATSSTRCTSAWAATPSCSARATTAAMTARPTASGAG